MKNQYDDIKYKRIGEIHKLKCGATAKIIDYTNRSNVKILIIENNEIRENVRYDHLKDGNVRLLYFPCIFGVGYSGEEGLTPNYSKSKTYRIWMAMLQRCYDVKLSEKYPNYIRARVCDEWLNYSNFKKWYDENYYEVRDETMCLDKDILVKGNKIYSPETCVFAPERINYLFVKAIKNDRESIVGVQFNKNSNKYEVSYNKLKINNQILYKRRKKYFDNINDAFLYYKNEKETFIRIVADYYKDEIPEKLYNAMCNWKVEITD